MVSPGKKRERKPRRPWSPNDEETPNSETNNVKNPVTNVVQNADVAQEISEPEEEPTSTVQTGKRNRIPPTRYSPTPLQKPKQELQEVVKVTARQEVVSDNDDEVPKQKQNNPQPPHRQNIGRRAVSRLAPDRNPSESTPRDNRDVSAPASPTTSSTKASSVFGPPKNAKREATLNQRYVGRNIEYSGFIPSSRNEVTRNPSPIPLAITSNPENDAPSSSKKGKNKNMINLEDMKREPLSDNEQDVYNQAPQTTQSRRKSGTKPVSAQEEPMSEDEEAPQPTRQPARRGRSRSKPVNKTLVAVKKEVESDAEDHGDLPNAAPQNSAPISANPADSADQESPDEANNIPAKKVGFVDEEVEPEKEEEEEEELEMHTNLTERPNTRQPRASRRGKAPPATQVKQEMVSDEENTSNIHEPTTSEKSIRRSSRSAGSGRNVESATPVYLNSSGHDVVSGEVPKTSNLQEPNTSEKRRTRSSKDAERTATTSDESVAPSDNKKSKMNQKVVSEGLADDAETSNTSSRQILDTPEVPIKNRTRSGKVDRKLAAIKQEADDAADYALALNTSSSSQQSPSTRSTIATPARRNTTPAHPPKKRGTGMKQEVISDDEKGKEETSRPRTRGLIAAEQSTCKKSKSSAKEIKREVESDEHEAPGLMEPPGRSGRQRQSDTSKNIGSSVQDNVTARRSGSNSKTPRKDAVVTIDETPSSTEKTSRRQSAQVTPSKITVSNEEEYPDVVEFIPRATRSSIKKAIKTEVEELQIAAEESAKLTPTLSKNRRSVGVSEERPASVAVSEDTKQAVFTPRTTRSSIKALNTASKDDDNLKYDSEDRSEFDLTSKKQTLDSDDDEDPEDVRDEPSMRLAQRNYIAEYCRYQDLNADGSGPGCSGPAPRPISPIRYRRARNRHVSFSEDTDKTRSGDTSPFSTSPIRNRQTKRGHISDSSGNHYLDADPIPVDDSSHHSLTQQETMEALEKIPEYRQKSEFLGEYANRFDDNTHVDKPAENYFVEYVESPRKVKQESIPTEAIEVYQQMKKAVASEFDRPLRELAEVYQSLKVEHIPRLPEKIHFNKYIMNTHYGSPFPGEFRLTKLLIICEFCMFYTRSDQVMRNHVKKCLMRAPPGVEIYRKDDISVFEVDGAKQKRYCKTVCLLSRMFLDSKTVFSQTEHYMFYIVTSNDEYGCHFNGYFSRERYSPQTNNLNSFMTLPCYREKGLGRFLIEVSYALSRRERWIGSPERPFSTPGRKAYDSYWKWAIAMALHGFKNEIEYGEGITIDDITQKTGIRNLDILEVVGGLGWFVVPNKKGIKQVECAWNVDWDMVDLIKNKVKSSKMVKFDLKYLDYEPIIRTLSEDNYYEPTVSDVDEDRKLREMKKKVSKQEFQKWHPNLKKSSKPIGKPKLDDDCKPAKKRRK